VFVTRPISAGFLLATVALLPVMILPPIRRRREQAYGEEPASPGHSAPAR
jgi:putative tricarboxylic transport membrane protein